MNRGPGGLLGGSRGQKGVKGARRGQADPKWRPTGTTWSQKDAKMETKRDQKSKSRKVDDRVAQGPVFEPKQYEKSMIGCATLPKSR